jgi:hypothetical protein
VDFLRVKNGFWFETTDYADLEPPIDIERYLA